MIFLLHILRGSDVLKFSFVVQDRGNFLNLFARFLNLPKS